MQQWATEPSKLAPIGVFSRILFVERSGTKRFNGKRDECFQDAQMFRLKNNRKMPS